MRRFLVTLPVALALFLGAAVPAYAAPANLPLLNPDFSIVPTECQACPCDYGGLLQLVQNLMNAGIAVGIIAFLLVTVYAGANFMLNPTNPEIRSKARSMFINVAVGFVIVLGAWLFVDFIMKILYNEKSQYGPWNKILAPTTAGSICIQEKPQQLIPGLNSSFSTGILGGGGGTIGGGGAGSATLGSGGTGSCNPAQVQAAAAQGGYSISNAEANILACLAKPESGCGANTTGAKTSTGQATSAAGPWQNVFGQGKNKDGSVNQNDPCHNLNIPACGNLQCSSAYSGGKPKSDPASQRLAAQCQAAIGNLTCSAAAAACLVQANGGSYSAWTGTGDGFSHAAQKACAGQ